MTMDDLEDTSGAALLPPLPHSRPRPRPSLVGRHLQRHRRRRSSAAFLLPQRGRQRNNDSDEDDDDDASVSSWASTVTTNTTKTTSKQSQQPQDLQALYQQAIRLHTSNKITTSNSWNLHLIENLDYFLEAVPEEEEETVERAPLQDHNAVPPPPLRVNFTKASCTLDASAKIYSYRVDDVHLTSYKVLANLHRSRGGDDEEPESQDLDGDAPAAATKTPAPRHRKVVTNADGTTVSVGTTMETNLGTYRDRS
jgi:Condensin complex subunit 2